jgi:hypothetical protein
MYRQQQARQAARGRHCLAAKAKRRLPWRLQSETDGCGPQQQHRGCHGRRAERAGPAGLRGGLNCCEPWCADGPNYESLRYRGFQAADEPGYPLLERHYDEGVWTFLDNARAAEHGRCLVHCAMGVNRSAAIVVAYRSAAGVNAATVRHHDRMGMELPPAVSLAKQARGAVLGNASFRAELVSFARHRGWLGSTLLRDEWLGRRPPPPEPGPFVRGAPLEAWRSAPLRVGERVRVHVCAEEWAEGATRGNRGPPQQREGISS